MIYLLATHNQKKCAEMQRILAPLDIEAATAEMLEIEITEAEETGSTFAENARIKAESGCKESGLPCIADDSGLCVDFLGGAPGVYSARYAGEHGNDEANIDKLLEKLNAVDENERNAHFACAICVAYPDGKLVELEGRCNGTIAFERHGSGGFGYDPVFMVGERSFAELSSEEKDAVSHRGNALRALVEALKEVH